MPKNKTDENDPRIAEIAELEAQLAKTQYLASHLAKQLPSEADFDVEAELRYVVGEGESMSYRMPQLKVEEAREQSKDEAGSGEGGDKEDGKKDSGASEDAKESEKEDTSKTRQRRADEGSNDEPKQNDGRRSFWVGKREDD